MAGLFGGKSDPVPMPPKTRMPDENDPAIIQARRRKRAEASTRSGRAATLLSDEYENDKLGGFS